MDQNSPYVREGSASYNIEDAGIGTFLADLSEDVSKAGKEGKLKADFPESKNSGSGQTAEITFTNSDENSGFMAYRVLVFFDDKTKLPTRMQLFNWKNETMGIYSYEVLQLNSGSEEATFKSQIQRQLYKLYNHQE